MERRIIPVILSGGAGTRLWPLSRTERPKQMLALTGEETMLQLTARRAADPTLFAPPLVVASEHHADLVEEQLAAAGIPPGQLILEPCGRNTAAAIALAALSADADSLLLVMPSDHVIENEAAFRAAVMAAAPLAGQDWLVTFGLSPDRPETGYGYIRRGEELQPGVHRVERFVEKPAAAAARAYLTDGRYVWNGGIFLFRAGAILAALAEHAPDILAATRAAYDGAASDGIRVIPDRALFVRIRAQSIDHAVFEAAERIAVAPVAMGWSDVGSWDALYALGAKDAHANVVRGDVVAIDSRNCLLRAESRRLVVIGIDDLIAIETDAAILIVPRGLSQRIREAIDVMQASDEPGAE